MRTIALSMLCATLFAAPAFAAKTTTQPNRVAKDAFAQKRGGKLDHAHEVYSFGHTKEFVTGWNGAYEWLALTRSADLVVTSTYSEAWETPGPIVTTPGLAATLGWDRSVSVSRVAPIVALFGLRWPSGGGAPTLISQRAAETEAARTTTGFGRYRLGTTYRTAGGDVVHFVHGAAAARQVRDVRRAGFRWVAIFTAGREGDRFWQRLAPQIGRRPTDVR